MASTIDIDFLYFKNFKIDFLFTPLHVSFLWSGTSLSFGQTNIKKSNKSLQTYEICDTKPLVYIYSKWLKSLHRCNALHNTAQTA